MSGQGEASRRVVVETAGYRQMDKGDEKREQCGLSSGEVEREGADNSKIVAFVVSEEDQQISKSQLA